MAISLRGLLRTNFKFITGNIIKPVTQNAARTLYSANSLSMDSYLSVRNHMTTQFETVSQTFRTKMAEFTNEENKSLIFTEDLKAMLHIVENNEEDINLLIKMIKKFHAQNNELRFGKYVFGPVVMRALYYLNLPDLALDLFKDPELQGFFDQLTSYQVLLTMLYNSERFQDMRDCYDIIRTKCTNGIIHPQNSIILIFAACYRQNTPESFEYALNLWKDMNQKGFHPYNKQMVLFSGLALKQNKPEFALEIISSSQKFNHIDVRCIKLQSFVDLNRLDNIYPFLKKILGSNRYLQGISKPPNFFSDTIENIEKAIQAAGQENYEDLHNLIQELRKQQLVQDGTLEMSLLRTIDRSPLRNKADPNSTFMNSNKRFNQTRNPQNTRATMKF